MRTRFLFIPLLITAGVALVVSPMTAAKADGPTVTVVASGLDNPRGVAIGPDRAVYVAQAGRGGKGKCITLSSGANACYGATGAITRIAFEGKTPVVSTLVKNIASLAPADGVEAIGVHNLAFDGSHGIATIGLGADPARRKDLGGNGARFGRLLHFDLTGAKSYGDDISAYETAANPDGGAIDSNPYGLALSPAGVLITDAGANAVLLDASGSFSTVAVLPNVMVQNPFAPPGVMVPMQGVPTTVTVGPDGAYYLGQLTGFPFPTGGASVFKIVPGSAPEVYATGFTNILDIEFGSDGSLYVLEIAANGLLSGNPLGALIRVAPDGTRSEIAPGALISPAGMAIGRDGSIYVSRFSTISGAGDVVRIK